MHIAVLYSQPSKRILKTSFAATDDDSEIISRAVAKALRWLEHTASIHGIREDSIPSIGRIQADCIFNLIEWCGLDIELTKQAFHHMRMLNIPVTGSSEKLFVLTGDKIALKKKLEKANMPVPKGHGFMTGKEPIPHDLRYPVIVKPSTEHCSIGLDYDAIAYKVSDLAEIINRQITAFEQPVLAEEFIDGREFEVYLLEKKRNVQVLPIEEVLFSGGRTLPFQTYSAKWNEKSADYQSTEVVVANLTVTEKKIIENTCIKVFQKLGLFGYARFDVRFRKGVPYLLETNANPSVYDDEIELTDVTKEVIWGVRFVDYIAAIVDAALYHFERGDKI